MYVWLIGTACELKCAPIISENRKQELIEVFAVSEKGLSKKSLFDGTDLLKRANPATVANRRTRLETIHVENLESKLDQQFGARMEHA